MSRPFNKFHRYQTGEPAIDRNLQQVEQNLNALSANPLNHGIIVKDVEIGTSATSVNHGLSRNINGWIVIKKNAAADIYQATVASNLLNNNILWLQSSATVTASLYIF